LLPPDLSIRFPILYSILTLVPEQIYAEQSQTAAHGGISVLWGAV
jgi:hypothetical protein